MNTTAIQPMSGPDAQIMESVLLAGDLSKLTAAQRVTYYQRTCESLHLNPLTRPFDYITLNGKMTLYAKKDAADQLRNIHGISIEKPDIQVQDDWIIVTVIAHDPNGRTDSDIAAVKKTDMQGNFGNALMKAMTKAKRRVTLSICGLGMLDETEVETIPGARTLPADPVTGEVDGKVEEWPEATFNQAEGEEEKEPIEIIDPMGPWAVDYAKTTWNLSVPDTCRQLGKMKLGRQFDKAEFIKIVNGEKKPPQE